MTTPSDCRNCGAALAGRYCSSCGQKADVDIPSLGQLLADAVGDLLSFDSRMWRSLAALVLRPGRLTSLYLQGQRARYTPPFRMYLIASVSFFLVFALVRAGTDRDEAVAAAPDAAVQAPPPLPSESSPNATPVAAGDPQRVTLGITIDDDDLECTLGAMSVDEAVRARLEAACRRVEDAGAASFNREFADNFPITMLVFIPLVAAIMKLLYVFERRKYVEHLVFFLHVHAFFFVVALVTVVLVGLAALLPSSRIPAWLIGSAAWLYFFAYLYRAMRSVYGQSRVRTALKYVALGFSYFAAAVLTWFGAVMFTAVTV